MSLQFSQNLLGMIIVLLVSQKHGWMNTNMTSMTYLTRAPYTDKERGEELVEYPYVWEMAQHILTGMTWDIFILKWN